MLVVLLLWCLPMLFATVLSAQAEAFHVLHAVLHSLSPLAWLLMSGLPAETITLPGTVAGETSPLIAGWYTGSIVLVAQIVVLGVVWGRRSRYSYVIGGLTTPAAPLTPIDDSDDAADLAQAGLVDPRLGAATP